MNIITLMIRATLEFIILSVIAVPFAPDPTMWLWYTLSVLLAFVLRLGIEYNKNTLTWRTAFIQTIYTISYCYFAIIVWKSYLNYGKGFEVYLFVNSLFAVFIVGQLENMFQMGFKKWVRNKAKAFIASEEKEDGI